MQVIWFVLIFVAIDLITLPIVLRAIIGNIWKPIADRYPPMEVKTDAISKKNQSIKIGAVNLGFSCDIAVDEQALHLSPTRWLRWMKLSPISIPWQAMTPIKQGSRQSKVKLDHQTLYGPAWALELAFVDDTTDTEPA